MDDGTDGVPQRWGDGGNVGNGPRRGLNPPLGTVSACLDDVSLAAVRSVVRAVQTADRTQIRHSLDAALAMTASRRVGVKYALRVGLWCAMTRLERKPVTAERLVPIADSIIERCDLLLTAPEQVLTAVLEDATRLRTQTYALPEAEFMLVAAVALAELMRLAPGVGHDLDALVEFAVRHCVSAGPADVEATWLATVTTG